MTDLRFKRSWGPLPTYPRVRGWDNPYPRFTVIAGPCSIESEDQVLACAQHLAKLKDQLPLGCDLYMRGGIFRAGTYPGQRFGLQPSLMLSWRNICLRHGLKNVVEVIDLRQIEQIEPFCDALQVGARQGQGYVLLKEMSKTTKPVFLKNGAGMTLDEILGALEYLALGQCQPRLILRGSSSFHNHVRWDLSLSLIPAIKGITKIPVIVDPSHGTGRRDLVRDMGLAGVAAGSDGILVEMHPDPDKSLSDAEQALSLEDGRNLLLDASALNIYRRQLEMKTIEESA